MTAEIGQSDERDAQGPGFAARVRSVLFFFFMLSVFLLIFGFFGSQFTQLIRQQLKSYGWQKIPCTVTQGDVKEVMEDNQGPCRFELAFTYRWDGRIYTGTSLDVGPDGSMAYDEAQRLAALYKPGTETHGYVNPENPEEAVLRHRSAWPLSIIIPVAAGLLLFLLIFIAGSAGGIYAALRPRSVEDAAAAHFTGAAFRWLCLIAVTCLFLSFFVFGVACLFFSFVKPVMRVHAATSWAETPCTVFFSRVRDTAGDNKTYRADVRYAYRIGGREYKANRRGFTDEPSGGREGQQAIVDRYPPGAQAICYVDPKDPVNAVLERGFKPKVLLGLVSLVFVLIGLIGLRACRRWARRPAAPPSAPGIPGTPARIM